MNSFPDLDMHPASAARILLFTPLLLLGLDPNVNITQYARRHWTVEDGLPQNYVTSLAQARDGALLVGTSGGVARFDGFSFSPVALDSTSGIRHEWINSLAVDSSGEVWIASRDAGIFRNKDGSAARAGPEDMVVSAVAAAPDGGVLAFGSRLWRHSGGRWTSPAPGPGAPDLGWEGLLPLPDGRTLVAAAGGAYSLDSSGALALLPVKSEWGQVLCLRSARENVIYAGTTRGLYVLRQNAGAATAEPVAGVPGPVVTIVYDRDGSVWAGTWGRGLYRVARGRATAWTTATGLADDFIHSMFEDSEANVWIGTRGGLIRLAESRLIPYGPTEGLNGPFVSAVAASADGSMMAATWRSGLYRRQAGSFVPAGLPLPAPAMVIRAIATGPPDQLWISAWPQLWHYDGSSWRAYDEGHFGHDPRVSSILVEPSGKLWLGTPAGLYEHPRGPILAPGRSRIGTVWVHCVLRGSDGRIWAGTNQGVAVVSASGAARVDGVPGVPVIALAEDRQSAVWAAPKSGGLMRISRGGVRNFDSRNGLPELPIHALLHDRRGDLWLATSGGLYRIPSSELPKLDGGRAAVVRYGQQDGMRTTECLNVGQPAAWRDKEGSLWFTTARGLIEVRDTPSRKPAAPTVWIESSSSAGTEHTVRFTTVALARPHRVEFRYRIDSRGENWTLIGAERMLRFSGLGAGTHRVAISAREGEGPWGVDSSVTIHQFPRWFETWAFRAAVAALLISAIYFIHRRRIHFVKGRYSAVMAERNRIAREWHDTLLAGFSAISWQLDAADARWRNKPEEVPGAIDLARRMVKHYRAEARRVIWDLRDEKAEPASLPASLRYAFERITSARPVEGGVSAAEAFPPLPAEVNLNLLRIAQEAITNAVEHATPTKIEVQLRCSDGFVELSVSDNGAGFDPEQIHPGHFGLAIMRERAEKLGGSCAIASREGGGTIVTARMPWKP